MRATAALVLAGLALAGCHSGAGGPEVAIARVGLDPIAGCEDLARALRDRLVADMDRALDANLATALEGRCWAYGGAVPPLAPAGDAGDGGGAKAFSDTNVQVAGVDEPDLVKTDGNLVYAIGDGRLQIVDAWPAAEAHRIAAVEVEGTPRRLLLNEGRVVVFSSLSAPTPEPGPTPVPPSGGGGVPVPGGTTASPVAVPAGDCTYGYDCVPTGDGNPSKITVLDVSDPARPRVLREVTFNGSYLAARRIGASVHAVLALPERTVPGLAYWPSTFVCGDGTSPRAIREAFEELRRANRALIEGAELGAFVPAVRDVRHDAGGDAVDADVLGACPGFHASAEGLGVGFVSIASLSTDGEGPLSVTTVLGRPGFVYAAPAALYVASPHAWRGGGSWFWGEPEASPEATTVHAFQLADAPGPRAEYRASGVVEGRVLSSFSLDEHAGALRIATTTGHSPDPAAHSAVAVLRDAGGVLEEVGRVDGIAPSEDIRSVRFDGARGFVVTFKKTDPLFVLDLADQAAPAIAGELKVPGFSTYLHLMDPDHLLTLGYDASDQGGFAWFTGIQLQLFDVADPAAPALAYRELIGTRGSTSQAVTDHLAFNYFAEKALLALPIVICEGGDPAGGYGDLMTFSGLRVYRVRADAGFTYLGGVAHATPETPETFRDACSGWWTDASTPVKRSLFLEDFVLSFTDGEVRVQDTRSLGADLARIDFTAP
ncbi:beta-propeller domain-containing protein [Anaeromyxobacter soli]|uniref:beta-propeller domain-containing protein n=1 Tax=Anaeromyxobacter soli TaxID=2922725 RepID=UPI001FAFF757|nr:beta-propeller domain-containing protein [Anaeromyxobacter sp. SG29]